MTKASKNIRTERNNFFVSLKVISQLKIVADLDKLMLQKTIGSCSIRINTTPVNFQINRIRFTQVRNKKPEVHSPFSATVYYESLCRIDHNPIN